MEEVPCRTSCAPLACPSLCKGFLVFQGRRGLNNTEREAPATCHSGPKISGPPQVMSPNVKESQTTAEQVASGSMPSDMSLVKEEPHVPTEQVKSEASTPKLEPSMTDVKEEANESDATGQIPDALQEEVPGITDDQPSS